MSEIAKYYEQYQIYRQYLLDDVKNVKDMDEAGRALTKAQKELAEYQERLESEKKVQLPDFAAAKKEISARANRLIDELARDYRAKVKDIRLTFDQKQQSQRIKFEKKGRALAKYPAGKSESLSEDEANCLTYVQRQYDLEDDFAIAEQNLREASEKEKLDCQRDINALIAERQKNEESYNGRIYAQQETLDAIDDQYAEPLARVDTSLVGAEALKKEQTAVITKTIAALDKEYEDEKETLNDRMRLARRSYGAMIMKAKLSGNDASRLEKSREKKLTALALTKEAVEKKYGEQWEALDEERRAMIAQADREIETCRKEADRLAGEKAQRQIEPQTSLDRLRSEKEQRLGALDRAVQSREQAGKQAFAKIEAEKSALRSRKKAAQADLEAELKKYAEYTNNGFDEALTKANDVFVPVAERKESYQNIAHELAATVSAQKAQDIYNGSYRDLAAMSYDELYKKAKDCLRLKAGISPFYLKKTPVRLTALLLGVLAAVLLYLLIKTHIAVAVITGAAVFLLLVIAYNGLIGKKLYQYDLALSLASEYRNLNAIRAYSSQQAASAETERIKKLGEQLYNGLYGRNRNEALKQKASDRLKKQYQYELAAAQEEAKSRNNDIITERNRQLDDHKAQCRSALQRHRAMTESLIRKVVACQMKCRTLNASLTKAQRKKEKLDKWYAGFAKYYRVLSFDKMTGDAGEKLCDDLYIIAEEAACFEEKPSSLPRPVTRLTYEQRPVVVLYDSDLIISAIGENKEEARRRTVEDILKTMLMAVKRANPEGLFTQFVANDPEVNNSFDNDQARRLMSIRAVVKKSELLPEALAENPAMVAFAHIVIEPEETQMADPTAIEKAILFYVCEKNEWLSGLKEDTVYARIHDTTDESCIIEYENGRIILPD